MCGADTRIRQYGQRSVDAPLHLSGPESVTVPGRDIIADLAAIKLISCCALTPTARAGPQSRRAAGELLPTTPHDRRLVWQPGRFGRAPACTG
jgi:hypothetical protein